MSVSMARVNNNVAVDGTGPDEYGLEVGQVVRVVGFVDAAGYPLQAVVATDHYFTILAWYLDPLPSEERVPTLVGSA